jgi:hypothetical protein
LYNFRYHTYLLRQNIIERLEFCIQRLKVDVVLFGQQVVECENVVWIELDFRRLVEIDTYVRDALLVPLCANLANAVMMTYATT